MNCCFLLDTRSVTWSLCLLNGGEVSRWTANIFWHWNIGSYESGLENLKSTSQKSSLPYVAVYAGLLVGNLNYCGPHC